jgi:hypothetical protein
MHAAGAWCKTACADGSNGDRQAPIRARKAADVVQRVGINGGDLVAGCIDAFGGNRWRVWVGDELMGPMDPIRA